MKMLFFVLHGAPNVLPRELGDQVISSRMIIDKLGDIVYTTFTSNPDLSELFLECEILYAVDSQRARPRLHD